MSETALIDARHLTKYYDPPPGLFRQSGPPRRALEDVSLSIAPGEVLGVIGEAGSGKTTLGRLLVNLLAPTSGQVFFAGQEVHSLDRDGLQRLRRQTQIVFQHPHAAFDPHYTLYQSLIEPLTTHTSLRGEALDRRVQQLLQQVALRLELLGQYPRALNAAQLQRAALARALALEPRFLVLDDPLSELEPMNQVQFLTLLEKLRHKLGFTALFTSRRPALTLRLSDRAAVLLHGRLVELAPAAALAQGKALHPHTQALQAAPPPPTPPLPSSRADAPPTSRPFLSEAGCSFRLLCPLAVTECAQVQPPLREARSGHWVACHRVDDEP